MAEQLSFFDLKVKPIEKVTNVASVPQRSPFRYPGGKTWLIPVIRRWLKQESRISELVEPFAGGGIVAITAAFEQLADHITMIELDEEVAAVWQIILSDKNEWLANKISTFILSPQNIELELNNPNKALQDIAFCTILKNRIFHGGILAKGSGLIKNGENGKGISSRWYAKTLRDRILAISTVRSRIKFLNHDAFDYIENNIDRADCFYFIDPPYTVAGRRLYTHFEVDHEELFRKVSRLKSKFMLTYDDTEEIKQLAIKYHLQFKTIPMKTTHHLKKKEIIISDNFDWWQ